MNYRAVIDISAANLNEAITLLSGFDVKQIQELQDMPPFMNVKRGDKDGQGK